MAMADTIAQRSHCVRRKAGTVIVDGDNRIVATGYNGAPRNYIAMGSCSNWCERARTGGSLSYDDCVAVHSETNALMHAERTRVEGGTLYVTSCPCFTCAKNVANSGVLRVVMRIGEEDRDREPERSIAMLRSSAVEVTIVS